MRNIKKIIIVLTIFTLSINFPFMTTKAAENSTNPTEFSTIDKIVYKYNKIATPTGKDGEYEISLNIKRSPDKRKVNSNIILILDNSSTMKYKLSAVKKSVNDFINNISKEVKNANIEIVLFSKRPSVLLNGFINLNDKAAVKNLEDAVNKIPLSWGTDTEAVFQKVDEEFLKLNSPNDKKYEVFFTDGLPDMINGNPHIISNKRAIPKAERAYDKLILNNPKIHTYSIGFLKDLSRSRFRDAIKFLHHVQNSGFYEANDLENIEKIYSQIGKKIINDNIVVKDAILTDTITGPFTIEKDGYGKGLTSKSNVVYTKDNTKVSEDINLNNAYQTIKNDSICWNLGDLTEKNIEDLTVKFKIKVKDQYFGGKKVFTNKNATFQCLDTRSNNSKIDLTFNKPTVDIPYKDLNISIKKTLSDGSKSNKEFTICLDGQNKGKYYFKIPGNGEAAKMTAYLKDEKTDISNNSDTSKNYFTAGTYKITEINSLGYNMNSINLKVNNKKLSANNNEITIDKDNNNIEIDIVNDKKSIFGFFDFDGIENALGKFIGLK